jgi:hypothetical protein
MPPFKTCPLCREHWNSREEFLDDPQIELIGYQVNFEALELGLFLFNHHTCETTMAIRAKHFKDMHKEPVYTERLTGTEKCPNYCLHKEILEKCPSQCECAYVRDILQIIRSWSKKQPMNRRQ